MPIDKQLLQKVRKTADEKIILSLEEKGFCVALSKDGSTVEKEARDVSEFLPLIESSSVSWVDYIVDDLKKEGPKIALSMGFSGNVSTTLLKGEKAGYEDLDSEMGLFIPAIMVQGFEVDVKYLLVLIRKNLVLTIHTTQVRRFFRLRRYAKIFMKKIKPSLSQADKITLVLLRIIDENNSRNFDHLREIEENSDIVSEKLSRSETPRDEIGRDIHSMRHALITYLSALWETVDTLNTLRYGDPELLTDDPKLLQRLGALVMEVNYQIGLAEHMSEVVASGLEVMQSIYNNQLQVLNNRLALIVAYLTILGTAVMVPNTIATIFGVPFLPLGSDFLPYYLIIIFGSTIISVAAAYWWVKDTGLLPEKAD